MFKLFKVFLALFILVAIERFCDSQTGGFRLCKIASEHPFNPHWETTAPTQDLEPILSQSFRFHSFGGESYVFLSEDGQTVIKFFKQHHMRTPEILKYLPLPKICRDFIRKRETKFVSFFNSCKIANEDFKDRSGLIYLHLNKTDHFKKKLKIIDKLNIAHEIDLDTTDFALQIRAELPTERFKRLIKNNQITEAKQSVDELLKLVAERCEKGIADRDPNIRRNCGFINDRAVELDLGSFSKDESFKDPSIAKLHLYNQTLKLKKWLSNKHPDLSLHIDQRLETLRQDL